MANTKSYEAVTPIDYDRHYAPGEEIDVHDDHAPALLGVGAIKSKAAKDSGQGGASDAGGGGSTPPPAGNTAPPATGATKPTGKKSAKKKKGGGE